MASTTTALHCPAQQNSRQRTQYLCESRVSTLVEAFFVIIRGRKAAQCHACRHTPEADTHERNYGTNQTHPFGLTNPSVHLRNATSSCLKHRLTIPYLLYPRTGQGATCPASSKAPNRFFLKRDTQSSHLTATMEAKPDKLAQSIPGEIAVTLVPARKDWNELRQQGTPIRKFNHTTRQRHLTNQPNCSPCPRQMS